MSPLCIRLSNVESRRVNLYGVVPNHFDKATIEEIRSLPILVDDQPATLGEVSTVIDGERDAIVFEGDLSRCDCVGGGLANGRVVVHSDVGDFLGERMTGGHVEINGSAGRFTCTSLMGGLVQVLGDCGEYAASAATGSKRGMNGGTLVIHGDCGEWLGTRMRRGTVVVHGRTAAACASRMIAGTLVLCGSVDYPLAADMQRGTILMLGHQVVCTAPDGFTDPEHTELSFLRMLLNSVAAHLPASLQSIQSPTVVFRSIGDRINCGQGEVIWVNMNSRSVEEAIAHA